MCRRLKKEERDEEGMMMMMMMMGNLGFGRGNMRGDAIYERMWEVDFESMIWLEKRDNE